MNEESEQDAPTDLRVACKQESEPMVRNAMTPAHPQLGSLSPRVMLYAFHFRVSSDQRLSKFPQTGSVFFSLK